MNVPDKIKAYEIISAIGYRAVPPASPSPRERAALTPEPG
jgi:hypothetical protein